MSTQAGFNFDMQTQTQSNWCWAATATSISIYYQSTSTWTQCSVANGSLGLSGCCQTPGSSACNVPWYLDSALTVTGNFASSSSGYLSQAQVSGQMVAQRPVGAAISWSGGGGHFVVISAYFYYMHMYRYVVRDSFYGTSVVQVWAMEAGYYQGSGAWTYSYLTQAAP